VQYAALIAVAEYVQQASSNEEVAYRFRRLKRPLLSDFVQFLQMALPNLRAEHRPWTLALQDALHRCRKRQVSVLRPTEKGIEEKKMPLLDGLVYLRNAFVHRRWAGQWELFVEHHAPLVSSLLQAFKKLAELPILLHTRSQEWLVLIGAAKPFSSVTLNPQNVPKGTRLVLADPTNPMAVLPLEPWMMWMDCTLCRKEGGNELGAEVFMFNGEDGLDRIAYIGSRHACSLKEPFAKLREAFLQASKSVPALPAEGLSFLVLGERARQRVESWLERQQVAGRYLPHVYKALPDMEAAIERFLKSPATGLLLVGESGTGKTALLSHLMKRWVQRNGLALAYDAAEFGLNAPVEEQILKDLRLFGDFKQLLNQLRPLGQNFVVSVDGFGQIPQGPELLTKFRDFVLRHEGQGLKVILACHPSTLDALVRAAHPELDPWQALQVEQELFPSRVFFLRDLEYARERLTTPRWTLGGQSGPHFSWRLAALGRLLALGGQQEMGEQFPANASISGATSEPQNWLSSMAFLREVPEPGTAESANVDNAALSVIDRWLQRMWEKRSVVLEAADLDCILPPPETSWRAANLPSPQKVLMDSGLWELSEAIGDPEGPRYLVPGSIWVAEHGLAARLSPLWFSAPVSKRSEFISWLSADQPGRELWVNITALTLAAAIQQGRWEVFQQTIQALPPPRADAVTLRTVRALVNWAYPRNEALVEKVFAAYPDQVRVPSLVLRFELESQMQGPLATQEGTMPSPSGEQGEEPWSTSLHQAEQAPAFCKEGEALANEGNAGLTGLPGGDISSSGVVSEGREVYYCGRCRRQQTPEAGARCTVCGAHTVSWFVQREDFAQAQQRWEQLFGGTQWQPSPGQSEFAWAVTNVRQGGTGMSQVFVDPDQLETFAARLAAFTKETDEVRQILRGSLQNLGATWRDQEYEKFLQAFARLEKVLMELASEIQSVHPKILADARFIREYQQIKL
jgi:uncharacterized protein YukE